MHRFIIKTGSSTCTSIVAAICCDEQMKTRIEKANELRHVYDTVSAEYIINDSESDIYYMNTSGFPDSWWLEQLAAYCWHYIHSSPALIIDTSMAYHWMKKYCDGVNQKFRPIEDGHLINSDVEHELFSFEKIAKDSNRIRWLFCYPNSMKGRHRNDYMNSKIRRLIGYANSNNLSYFHIDLDITTLQGGGDPIEPDVYESIQKKLTETYRDLLPEDPNPKWTNTPHGKIYLHPGLIDLVSLGEDVIQVSLGYTKTIDPVFFIKAHVRRRTDTIRKPRVRFKFTWLYTFKNRHTILLTGKTKKKEVHEEINLEDICDKLDEYANIGPYDSLRNHYSNLAPDENTVNETINLLFRANLILRPILHQIADWMVRYSPHMDGLKRMPRCSDKSVRMPIFYRALCTEIASINSINIIGDLIFLAASAFRVSVTECPVVDLQPYIDKDIYQAAVEHRQSRNEMIDGLASAA